MAENSNNGSKEQIKEAAAAAATGRMYFDGLHVNMLDTQVLLKKRLQEQQTTNNGVADVSVLQENSEVAQICLELN